MSLCELSQVLIHEEIAATNHDHDSLLGSLIVQVSEAMAKSIGQPIEEATATTERIDSIGQIAVYTRHSPIISITTLLEGTSTLTEDTHFECLAPDQPMGKITRISGGVPYPWASGLRKVTVTYVHGYAVVPGDLELACIKQVRHEFKQTKPSGANRLGATGKALDSGGSLTYVPDGFLPSVEAVLRLYRRGPF